MNNGKFAILFLERRTDIRSHLARIDFHVQWRSLHRSILLGISQFFHFSYAHHRVFRVL